MLSVPFFCPRRMALAFLEKNREWVESHRKDPLCFRDGMSVSILDKQLIVHHFPEKRFATHVEGNELWVAGDIGCLNRRVTDFVRRQTEVYIQEKAQLLATRIGQKINRISLKDTTSRWGSCSGKKNLNFCWRLGLAPLFVLDYIIAHEVAHLAEMNHGPRFWRLVSQINDDRSRAEIWLRRHGQSLR